MLGVLKRRWKPKRASSNNNNNNNNNSGRHGKSGADLSPCEISAEKHRVATSPRQIHPACEEKAQIVAYDEDTKPTDAPPSVANSYPLAPNICVEAGRIEFIKPPPENAAVNAKALPDITTPPTEKVDVAKDCLEARVKELEAALEAEKKAAQRERLAAAKLQRQLARREVLQRDVDREKRLRLDSECRLRNSVSEAERCRARLATLQREFTRMEETVRSMLQYKSRYEQLKQDKISLSAAYENRVHKFQSALSKLTQENETLKKQVHMLEAAGAGEVQAALVERLRVLELNNCTLSREGEVQRKQYERCLDDVANQVVRALLAQKSLREEISNLQQRVKDLETQNRALTTLLLQQLQSSTRSSLINQQRTVEPVKSNSSVKFALPAPGRPSSCDDARLRVWEESVVWLPLQRPSSLNLEACCRAIPVLGEGGRKSSGEEDEGSESPESGNRDEGYSTMSSDVQGLTVAPRRGLEEVKEASDETENAPLSMDCNNAPERLPEPEVVLIPLSLALSVSSGSRHSYPPLKELLPYQHIMRSFSDSHLCIKLTAAPNGSNYSLASAESVLVLERPPVPLCRSRAVGSTKASVVQEEDDDTNSWCSGDWWDADYVQHWLRLDETRSALQQQMEYDAAELEDWSMDENEIWRKCELPTPSQALPSIRESSTSELEEDSNECLWNSSSYLVDQVLTTDGSDSCRGLWPYGNHCLISPGGDSWSSAGTNSEDGRSYNECCQNGSKRSSTAMSTDSGEIPLVGTDFTRDFYRLVKFESTKSLASTSSRSQTGESVGIRRGDLPVLVPVSSDREQALQSVLHFIAEQQQYCLSREVADGQSNDTFIEEVMSEAKDITKDHLCETATEDSKDLSLYENENKNSASRKRPDNSEPFSNEPNASYSEKSCGCKILVEEDRNEMEKNCDNEEHINSDVDLPEEQCQQTEVLHSDDSSSKYSSEKTQINIETCKRIEYTTEQTDKSLLLTRPGRTDSSRSGLRPVPEEDEEHTPMSESLKSAAPMTYTVLKAYSSITCENKDESVTSLQDSTDSAIAQHSQTPVVIAGPRSISFHERATTKDVIDELNRMIRKGEDGNEAEGTAIVNNLDVACCCPTGWVHVDREIDFTDPKARANLLDVMLAASHSSSSAGSSSSNSDSGDEPADYQHLHRLHRFRRQKKASASREPLGALRCPSAAPRPSIIGRNDFYVRYGEKEMEAVASFDFLEDMSTTSVSGASSCENANPIVTSTNITDTTPSTDDSEHPGGEQLSLSDSCGASFSGSEPSLNMQ